MLPHEDQPEEVAREKMVFVVGGDRNGSVLCGRREKTLQFYLLGWIFLK